jgi:hypothetical protein
VVSVDKEGAGVPVTDGFERWRVTGKDEDDLCPALFEALRRTSWKVAELRSDTRTLEAVFRELAQAPDVETDEPPPSSEKTDATDGKTSAEEEVRA